LAELVSAEDPIAAQRARIARLASLGKRVGYACLAVALVAFIVGAASDFPTWSVTVTVVALVLAIVVLPVPIILGYGVRAAEREERQQPGH
jgi:hypothetical protein